MSNLNKYYIFVFVLLVGVLDETYAQEMTIKRLETEQILNYFRARRNPALHIKESFEQPEDRKCGFWIQAQIIDRWNDLTLNQKIELSGLLKQSVKQSEVVIGHFRISFDTTGSTTPALLDKHGNSIANSWSAYVDSVGRIFNEVWDVEILELGYKSPPLAGDSLYNIYINNLSDTEYGATMFFDSTQINIGEFPPRYRSYIEIDNDFDVARRYSIGMNALKVTAAHEFNHAIQIGSYGFWSQDTYAHEITSTWIEDAVYTDVNDYFQYLPKYFGDANRSSGFWMGWPLFANNLSGYERAIWGHFLGRRFSPVFMTRVWEQMQILPFIESTESVLASNGFDLQSVFAEFAKWNYFTAERANTVQYYPEGDKYPRFQPLRQTSYSNYPCTDSIEVSPLSSSFYEFNLKGNVITTIAANVDVVKAKQNNFARQKLYISLAGDALPLSDKQLVMSQEVMNDLKILVSADTSALWRSFILQKVARPDAAPNPFRLSEAQKLFLPVNEDKASSADVYFYNSSFDLAYSGQLKVTYNENGGTRVIEVPASAISSKLSSGIYFIIAKTQNSEYKWKVAIIR